MKYLIAVTLMLFTTFAFAAEATSQLSWEAPAVRVDGTPLTTEEIAEYQVFYAIDNEVTTESTMVTISSDATSEAVTLTLEPRQEPYTVSFAILTVDSEKRESALSDPVSKVFQVNSTAVPNPPTNLQFSIVCENGCTIEQIQ